MDVMAGYRIKQLREAAGLTQEQLGELVGRTKSTISRIEDGTTSLDLELAKKIAEALDTSLGSVLDIETPGVYRPAAGFRESDVEPWSPPPNDPFARLVGDHEYFMLAKSGSLSRHGINEGDVLFVNDSAITCAAPPSLAPVIVQYNEDPGRSEHTIELLRQFVPPGLLITNAGERNERAIDMSVESAVIVGVVLWSRRRHV